MDEGLEFSGIRETDSLAKQLSVAIRQSGEYTLYRQKLEELREQPELYGQVNNLRRNNFQRQNSGGGRMTYDEYSAFAAESRRLRANPLVNEFLDAEVSLGRLLQDINRIIISEIDFDNQFLD
ncbi:MAG: YlbF family regulator [Butyrivibrio sp.]|nr:YlbF family regulator [Butyrivibrio sp.]